MSSVQEAIDALRSALHKKGAESHIKDAFNHIASCLILLNSSFPSAQMIRKLCTVLHQPLLPLYNTCLQPALQLSCSILSTVLGKLYNAHSVEDETLRSAWDATAKVILSGVLDFLEGKDGVNIGFDGTAWEALYRIICDFFFLGPGKEPPVLSTALCLSAYNTLAETAARQITVRNALRHKAALGGDRLGAAISRSKDYLLLEALLMLFVRLLPPIRNSEGKLGRADFVKAVLGSPKLFKCSAELVDIMRNASGNNQWDDIAAKIIDALAKSDITYPQPFSIDEIEVCGHVFPQPLVTDRLLMDKHAFLANIVVEDNDLCESLQVPYSHIRTITLDTSEKVAPKGRVLVMVQLTSPPSIANVEVKSPDGSPLYAKFLLQDHTIGRFMEALRRRGVGKLCFLNPLTRAQKKRKSVSIGSGLKFMNNSSPVPVVANFEGKVQHVNQVYRTNFEESEAISVLCVQDMGISSLPNLTPAPEDENPASNVLKSAIIEDVSKSLKDTGNISSSEGMTNAILSSVLIISPRTHIRASQLFGDSDELSEISEFELEDNAVIEPVSSRVATFYDRGLEPTQHKIDPQRIDENSNVTVALGAKKSSEADSKAVSRAKEVARMSSENGKPLLASNSPESGLSSSTQIGVSAKPLSDIGAPPTVAGTDVIGNLCVALKKDFVSRGKASVLEYGHPDTETITTFAGKPQMVLNFVEDEHGRQPEHFTPTSDSNQKDSCSQIIKDTNVPPETAGGRRKRETTKPSSKAIVETDDEFIPPRKRRREDKAGIKEDKTSSDQTSSGTIPTSRTKTYSNPTQGSSPSTDPTMVEFNELSEPKSAPHGIRRSSRTKKKQTATAAGTRASATRRKAPKRSQTGGHDAKVNCNATLICGSPAAPTPAKDPPPNFNHDVLGNTEYAALGTSLPSEALTVGTIDVPFCDSSSPSVAFTKRPEDLNPVQQTASGAKRPVEEKFYNKTKEFQDDQLLMSGLCDAHDDLSFPSTWGGDPVKLSHPTMHSTPPTKKVTIDLTIDDSPPREKSDLHKATIASVRSEVDFPTKLGTPNHDDSIVMEEPAFAKSPRQRHRSVTFASPIEYVLDKKVKSRPPAKLLSRRSLSPSESDILSLLKIPAGPTFRRRDLAPDQIASQATLQRTKTLQAPVHAEEAEIQDIVEVLNEIQAVIIKGISNRFRNVKREVQRGRDELIQQVLDELRVMVAENARYFNGLVRLEEDYSKNSRAITRCWEELIDSNDDIATQFRNALVDHDQNISAKTFPRSLLPLKPASLCRRAHA